MVALLTKDQQKKHKEALARGYTETSSLLMSDGVFVNYKKEDKTYRVIYSPYGETTIQFLSDLP